MATPKQIDYCEKMKGRTPWNKGLKTGPLSEEHRKKIQESNSGRGKGIKREPFTSEHKKNMSECKLGDKHPNWKGGIFINNKHYKSDWLHNLSDQLRNLYRDNERNRYKNLSDEDKMRVSWSKNKRNRLKRATIEELGSHTYSDWCDLKKEYNYTCPCCGLSEPLIKLTEDHIIPLSKDGTDLINNIQPLCLHCNVVKNNKIIKY